MSAYNMVEKLLERNGVFTLNLIFVSPVISMGIKAHVTLISLDKCKRACSMSKQTIYQTICDQSSVPDT